MTDKPDWAVEIAKGLARTGNERPTQGGVYTFMEISEVAASHRNLKIETLRQAAHMTRADCYVMADNLEKGEPNV